MSSFYVSLTSCMSFSLGPFLVRDSVLSTSLAINSKCCSLSSRRIHSSSRRIRSSSHHSCLLSSSCWCSASTCLCWVSMSNLRTSFIDTASSHSVVSTLNNSPEFVDIKPCLQLFLGFHDCRIPPLPPYVKDQSSRSLRAAPSPQLLDIHHRTRPRNTCIVHIIYSNKVSCHIRTGF